MQQWEGKSRSVGKLHLENSLSAHNATENFIKWGFSGEMVKEADKAISEKDNQELSTKPLIAKCVQCADSTEYGRVGSFNPKYLDIYKDFNGYQNLLIRDEDSSNSIQWNF